MKKDLKKWLSLLLASVMVIGTLAACGKDVKEPTETETETETTTETETATTEENETPLVVGYSPFSEKFSPFFADTGYDMDVEAMTQVPLITTDRTGAIIFNSIEGETKNYNGTDYTYKGISDVTVTKGDAETIYNIKIRDDVTFSDGTPLTANDIIFSLYVLADTNYDGSSSIYSQPIKGMKNYRANSTAAESVTADEIAAKVAEMPQELQDYISTEIITPVLTSEVDWVASLYEDEAYATYTAEYPETKDLFAFFYGGEGYDSTAVATVEEVLADIIEIYGSDYQLLGSNYGGDPAYYQADVDAKALELVLADKAAAGEGEEIDYITGIEKINDYEVQITTTGYAATTIYNLAIEIAPLHYYGDPTLFDYDNHKFGFTRGDLSIVREKTTQPMGAGPYKFVKYENKTVYFEANDTYFKGTPAQKYIQFKETLDADKIAGVEQGTIDITDPQGSKAAFEQIAGNNSNGEISGDKITTSSIDNLGYGYIGMNADTVNVAGDPSSDASKSLRKAIATVLSVYREVTIDTWYGDAASVINYPISNTSWAAPQKSDADYKIAYSEDATGTGIFTDGMAMEDKYAAALQASLTHFEAAGYTVTDGKLTAAPDGAKLEYEVIIPADGQGNHPSFAILTDAKAALETIGFNLIINDPADSNELWNALDAGTQELWCAAWGAPIDPDMYQTYFSTNIVGLGGTNSNHYHIADEELDTLIMDARTSDDQTYRKTVYKQCLDIILDWAVEIPVYQRQNCYIFSTERVNIDSIAKDVTPFYSWLREVETVKVN